MRRLSVVMMPALLMIGLSGIVEAQTRTAPSITGAVRRLPPSPPARTGVSARAANLPQEQACRDRWHDRRSDGRYDQGATGTGRIDARVGARGTITQGRVYQGTHDRRNDGCGYYDSRGDRTGHGRYDGRDDRRDRYDRDDRRDRYDRHDRRDRYDRR